MNKAEVFNHYSRILNKLIDNTDFFRYYLQYTTSIDEPFSSYDISQYCRGFDDCSFTYASGVSRGCLISESCDYVVKFDLDSDFGSCESEAEIYDLAVGEGVEKFFAQPLYIGNFTRSFTFYRHNDLHDELGDPYWFDEKEIADKLESMNELPETATITISIPLYAYPRANERHFYSSKYDDYVSHSNSPLAERDFGIANAFIEDYSMEDFDKLSSFLNENNITDLHTGNVMEYHGKVILTDYCSVGA